MHTSPSLFNCICGLKTTKLHVPRLLVPGIVSVMFVLGLNCRHFYSWLIEPTSQTEVAAVPLACRRRSFEELVSDLNYIHKQLCLMTRGGRCQAPIDRPCREAVSWSPSRESWWTNTRSRWEATVGDGATGGARAVRQAHWLHGVNYKKGDYSIPSRRGNTVSIVV